jgi:tetratricopeptide (TPR) repeat protein
MSSCAALVRSLLTLRKERRSGVLSVTTEGVRTFIYLDQGTPVFAEEGTNGETLGRLLVRQGRLTQAQYVEVIGKMTDAFVINEQLRFGEVCVELGYLTEAQVGKALADQVRWKIVRVFQRVEATWELDEGVSRLEDIGRFPMTIESLVLDAVRWIDDEQKIELGLGQALDKRMKVEKAILPLVVGSFELSDDEEAFVATLDGSKTMRDVFATSAAQNVDARAVATALLLTRALQPAGTPPLATPDKPFVPVKIQIPVQPPAQQPPVKIVEPVQAAKPTEKKIVRPQVTKASEILAALEAKRIKAEPSRSPTSEHEARIMAERVFQAGLIHLRGGRYRDASPFLDQAARMLPANDEYKLHAKWCGMRARGETSHPLVRHELKRLATTVSKADPNLGFAWAVLGEVALEEGENAHAFRHLLRATKLDPELLEAQRQLRIVERTLDPKKRSSIRQSQTNE